MTMTITLSDNLAQKLTQYLKAYRKANVELDNAIEALTYSGREEAARERDQAARRLACILDCAVVEELNP